MKPMNDPIFFCHSAPPIGVEGRLDAESSFSLNPCLIINKDVDL